jgi:DNA modification methylase
MTIIFKSPRDLIPYEDNPRTHPPEQITQLTTLIKRYGFHESHAIAVDEDGVILWGHGRQEAAIAAGLDSVPVEVIPGLSDADKRALRIADNGIAEQSDWDMDALQRELDALQDDDYPLQLLSLDEDLLEELGAQYAGDFDGDGGGEYEGDEDEIPDEADVETRAQRGQVWQLGRHRVMCGDSTDAADVELLMDGARADMVFTDPPYGVSYGDKNKFLNNLDKGNGIQTPIVNDHLSIEDTGTLWRKTFQVWSEYLADYSSYYVASPQVGDLFLMMMKTMNENGFPLRHCLIWVKNHHVLGRCDYNYKHEPILFGWKGRHKFYGNGTMKTSTWEVPKPLKNDLHPTMKPVALVENAILNSTEQKMLCVDFFLGSGTTLIAAEKTGRTCYGMEFSPAYVDVILKRWEDFTGDTAKIVGSL